MSIFTYMVYFLLGIINGGIFVIMLFQMDKTYQKVISTSGNGAGIFVVYEFLNWILKPDSDSMSALLVLQLSGFFASVVFGFYFLFKNLKNQDGKSKLTVLDIIVGYHNLLQIHYDLRKKEIDTELNYNILKNMKDDLDKREELLNSREDLFISSQKAINEQLKRKIHIELPVNACIPLDQEAINLFPSMVQSLIYFTNVIYKFTSDFERRSEEKENKENQFRFLFAYLFGICEYINKCLFASTRNDVCIYFRVNIKGTYVELLDSLAEHMEDNPLMPMPSDKGIIYECIQCRRSLIKSLNRGIIQSGNDRIWLDYITFCINGIITDEKPLLIMGISVKDPDKYRRLMYFLNYCKFEDIIQESIERINKKISIFNALKPYIEQKEREV